MRGGHRASLPPLFTPKPEVLSLSPLSNVAPEAQRGKLLAQGLAASSRPPGSSTRPLLPLEKARPPLATERPFALPSPPAPPWSRSSLENQFACDCVSQPLALPVHECRPRRLLELVAAAPWVLPHPKCQQVLAARGCAHSFSSCSFVHSSVCVSTHPSCRYSFSTLCR